jgi:putative nucleotidyltransferase with HDIG domain
VSDAARQLRQADEFVRRMTAAVRANQLYAPSHPLAGRALKALAESAGQLLAEDSTIAVGFIDNEVVVGEIPLVQVGDAFAELLRRVRQVGIERIAFDRGVTPEELGLLVETLARPERAGVTASGQAADPLAVLGDLKRIRVGRLMLEERVASAADVATIRRLYTDGVSIAGALWEMTQREGTPDPKQAKALVDSLAQAVAQNRTALMALTALKDYDNYTFTHMVNVSILVMAQARSLGIDGALLREFGLAALMHDIGKVRTPLDVLNKPDKLSDAEFAIMRMHVVDGAEILRRTPEIPWPSSTTCGSTAPATRWASSERRSTWARCSAASRMSTTRCAHNAPTRARTRPNGSWPYCRRATACISISTWCAASRS